MDIVNKPAKFPVQSMPGTVALLDGFGAAPEVATGPLVPKDSTGFVFYGLLGLLIVGGVYHTWRASSSRPTRISGSPKRRDRGPTVAEYEELYGHGKARYEAERRRITAKRRERRHARKESRAYTDFIDRMEFEDAFS